MNAPRHSYYWANHSSDDFKTLISDKTVVVLPVGAIEQHGPHLPVSVDMDINNGLVEAAIDQLVKEPVQVLFLPLLSIGKSTEHIDFPGTLTFSAETLLRMWGEVIDGVAATGVKRLVIFNSHGGQAAPMEIIARDLRIKHNMLVFSCNWSGLGLPKGLLSDHEETYGIHAGELETAMMLHLHPEKCQMEKAQNFKSQIEILNQETSQLGLSPGGKLAWKSNDLNPHGACGNAANATAETGQKAVKFVAGKLIELLKEVSAYNLDQMG